jgi:excisionase family DNA binding protein
LAGIGRSMLYELIRAGQLASLKIGRRRLVLVSTLMAFLRSREVVA